jgi:hypothetical protein
MASEKKEAGYYELISLKITSLIGAMGDGIELNQIVTSWQITEGLSRTNITGSLMVLDAEGIIRKLDDKGILGEETITIKYKDFYDVTRTDTYFVFGVRSVTPFHPTNEKMLSYRLDFTSMENFNASQKEVANSYNKMKISDIAKEVYDEFFEGPKPLEIEETEGFHTLVIPRASPHDAMNFLARRAYGGEDSMSNWSFYETLDSFMFCTPDYAYNKYKAAPPANNKFTTQKTMDDNTPGGQRIAQQTVSDIDYGSPINTIEEIKEGDYKRKVLNIDLLNRTTSYYDYEYKDNIQNNPLGDVEYNHLVPFIDQYMPNIREDFIIKDFNTPGQVERAERLYPFYAETITSRRTFDRHMAKYTINCTIKGRNGLVPGMTLLIDADVQEVAKTPEIDQLRSGEYMITDITNAFFGDGYTQTLSITKGGLKGGLELVGGG